MTAIATTGLDALRAVQAGEVPAPGIARLLGFSLTVVEHGHVECELLTRDDMTNPMGSVHGGIAATLLDTVMGCAVHSVLPADARYTTTDLQVRYVRPVVPGTRVRARGTVVHQGRRLVTAVGELVDDADRLVAHATTGCLVTTAA